MVGQERVLIQFTAAGRIPEDSGSLAAINWAFDVWTSAGDEVNHLRRFDVNLNGRRWEVRRWDYRDDSRPAFGDVEPEVSDRSVRIEFPVAAFGTVPSSFEWSATTAGFRDGALVARDFAPGGPDDQPPHHPAGQRSSFP